MKNTDIKCIRVKTSTEYNAVIGKNTLGDLPRYFPDNLKNARKAAIITDSNVKNLYESKVKDALIGAGLETFTFSFPAGEASKNIYTLSDMLEFLAENKLTRSDMVIALGGGVTGDMAGFAAGVYLRGIALVQIPTTFLAAVDSSVGGKTAVDLKSGKNLAGVFYQPCLTFCDTDTFKTLSDDIFSDGAAESLKHGIIRDKAFFEAQAGKTREELFGGIVSVAARNIEIKADIVGQDEFDTGIRQLLNFGHTAGHGIEKLSGYKVPHGKAVAIGMATMARAAERLGFAKEPVAAEIIKALKKASLPVTTDYSAEEIYNAALSDKKRSGGKINIVIPVRIGECVLKEINIEDLLDIIKAGLVE